MPDELEAARHLMLRLRDERERRGISQQAVADELGTAQSAISDWDRGTMPTLSRLLAYARVLGFDLVLIPNGTDAEFDALEVTLAAERVAHAVTELRKAVETLSRPADEIRR